MASTGMKIFTGMIWLLNLPLILMGATVCALALAQAWLDRMQVEPSVVLSTGKFLPVFAMGLLLTSFPLLICVVLTKRVFRRTPDDADLPSLGK